MSLCYDAQKWTMLTLSSIAVSMIVGLVLMQYAHGYTDPTPYIESYIKDPLLITQINSVNDLEKWVNYCFEHADRPNPLQDLRDKGFNVTGSDCKALTGTYAEQLDKQNQMIAAHNIMIANNTKYHFCDLIDPVERNNYPNCREK
jgi:hypothetical protein